MEMTLGEAFARSARKYPGKIACMDERQSVTYGALNRRVNRWFHALKGLRLEKGDRVATLSNTCIPLMEVYLANLKRGLVTVPLNSRGTLDDIRFQTENTECRALIFEKDFSARAEALHASPAKSGAFHLPGGPEPRFCPG
jgi:acyl-CoA synthetase (AMP-forming)/AMP-acid ligase II